MISVLNVFGNENIVQLDLNQTVLDSEGKNNKFRRLVV